ncbi:PREDICTED: serine/threonine-protein phosphatase 4 regulatory subunit 2-A-like isoform X1 [Poecilia mexicana]|uniref:Serine/threonine-protein phosphatase 4 regulatory subunit 2 n=1 Tax=Poecilia mexicana TaxID=48701 RepID=A0A3B3WXT1_9TELE|nr:PREDICTED: serine/threonine-protein phosphatase 4 regulatory subunit 2-A-like isoform X1 [Poecilia mexicana]
MDIDAILEAFQDFEKRGKKETCPALEQFLCHVAKTGQPMIPWSQFKTYFLFKLDKVMEDFHASTPEERDSHNPNVEYIPFEEMKKRILKIVDGYNGIPFTIQRLCELLTDPKRNYTGTDKFLRGLEKNVMVVSYLHPTSEKNGTSTINRMNGVMFLGNSSLYSESSRNVNGPSLSKTLNRPKLSSSSLSTNGLPECPASKDPDGITETEEHHSSETPPSEDEAKPKHGIKHKHREEDEESDCDKQEAKKRKTGEYDDEKEREENESSCHKEPESSSDTPESEEDTCGQECSSETYHDTPCKSDSHGESSTPSEPPEREGESNDAGAAASVQSNISVDQSEQATPSETHSTSEQDSALCNSSSSDAEGLPSEKASCSNSPELPIEGGAETSDSAETTLELGEGN